MKVRQETTALRIESYSTFDLSILRSALTWYNREGTLKELEVGDLVQSQEEVKVKSRKVLPKGRIVEVLKIDWGRDEKNRPTMLLSFFNGKEECTASAWSFFPVIEETLLHKDKDGYYTLPCLFDLIKSEVIKDCELINPSEVEYFKEDINPNILTDITLWDFQVAAVQKCVMLKRGIVLSSTGSGKSIMQFAFLKHLFDKQRIEKGLIVVPSMALAKQFVAEAKKMGFQDVGEIHQSKKDLDKQLTIAVIHSIYNGIKEGQSDMVDFILSVGAICLDETQHARADMHLTLIRMINLGSAQYLIGFSASPFLSTEPMTHMGDVIIRGYLGRIIFQIPNDYLIEIGMIAKPIVLMKDTTGHMDKTRGSYANIYKKHVVKNITRNMDIVKYARKFTAMKLITLILCQRLEHALNLMELLKGLRVICVFGSSTGWTFDEIGIPIEHKIQYDVVRDEIVNGNWDVVIGSTVFDEGFDCKNLGAVIMGASGKSMIKGIQRLGRGLRKKKGENVAFIVDFNDRSHVYLYHQSRKREEIYRDMGADIHDEVGFNRALFKFSGGLNE